MTQNTGWKKAALAALCLFAVFLSTSCGRKGDPSSFNTLAIVTYAPVYTAAPANPDDWNSWGGATSNPFAAASSTLRPVSTPVPTLIPSPTPTSNVLRNGDSGERVRAMQQRLKELGYLTGSADGDFGDKTEDAVRAFQRANGLSGDGIAGTRTLEKLNSSSAKKKSASTEALRKATSVPSLREYTPSEPKNYRYLELGSSGKDVTRLQNRLRELGYLSGGSSGSYDAATEAAVVAFQRRNGQWVDGVAGEDTQSSLFSSKALPAKNSSND